MTKRIIKIVQFQITRNYEIIVLLSNGKIFRSGGPNESWHKISWTNELKDKLEPNETF